MSFDKEPEPQEWYNTHTPEEQEDIDRMMEQCPRCGEWLSKSSQVLDKNGGICRICRLREDKDA